MDKDTNYRTTLSESAVEKHAKRLKEKLECLGVIISMADAYNHYAQIAGFKDYDELKQVWLTNHRIRYGSTPKNLVISMESFEDFIKMTKNYSYINFTSGQNVWAEDLSFIKITENETNEDLMRFIAMKAYGSYEVLERIDNKEIFSFIANLDIDNEIYKFVVNINRLNKENINDFTMTFKRKAVQMPLLKNLIKSEKFINNINTLKPGIILITGLSISGKSTLENTIAEHHLKLGLNVTTFEKNIEYVFNKKSNGLVNQIDISKATQLNSLIKQALMSEANILMIPETTSAQDLQELGLFNRNEKIIFSTMHTQNAAQSLTKLLSNTKENHKRSVMIDLMCNLKLIIGCRLFTSVKEEERCYLYEILKIDGQLIDEVLSAEDIVSKSFEKLLQEKINYQGLSFFDYAKSLLEIGNISEEFFQEIKKQLKFF